LKLEENVSGRPEDAAMSLDVRSAGRRVGYALACSLALAAAAIPSGPPAQREPPGPPKEKAKGDEEAKKDEKQAGRRQPAVLNVEEARAAVARVQVRTYLLEEIQGKIYVPVLEDDKAARGLRAPELIRKGAEAAVPVEKGKLGGYNPFKKKKKDLITPDKDLFEEGAARKVKRVEISKVKDDDVLATQVHPVRMALIAAAFPFKKQVEEHRRKLGLRSNEEVLAEASPEKGKGKDPQFSFRFLRVVAERRELDADGKPAAGEAGKWKKLDLDGDYRDYVAATGGAFQPEDEVVQPLVFPGLVMPRLPQFRHEAERGEKTAFQSGQYPPIERGLKKLTQTLKWLKDRGPGEVAAPSRFSSGDDFNPFGDGSPPAKDKRPARKPKKDRELPEYCLVRVVDVTVQPGKTYEYRLKVRMANPNYQRRDVASPAYARDSGLESAEWSQGVILRVDPELHYYAVNQEEAAKAAKEKYADRYSRNKPLGRYLRPTQMMFFQAHRWVESIKSGRKETPIGEWVIAERFPVYRGDFVGRWERVEAPRWNPGLEDFVLATDSSSTAKDPGIRVNFGTETVDGSPPLLVDFEYGPVSYTRMTDKGRRERMTDESAGEAVLLSADGKLILRQTVLDAADEERIERLKAVRKRIAAIKGRGEDDEGKKGPFDK
jgi:hypothetical protein